MGAQGSWRPQELGDQMGDKQELSVGGFVGYSNHTRA